MPCIPTFDKDGYCVSIRCSRGSKPIKKCHICGKPMTKYCDVCDMQICDEHSHKVAFDTDVCPAHNNENDIKRAIERRMEL